MIGMVFKKCIKTFPEHFAIGGDAATSVSSDADPLSFELMYSKPAETPWHQQLWYNVCSVSYCFEISVVSSPAWWLLTQAIDAEMQYMATFTQNSRFQNEVLDW